MRRLVLTSVNQPKSLPYRLNMRPVPNEKKAPKKLGLEWKVPHLDLITLATINVIFFKCHSGDSFNCWISVQSSFDKTFLSGPETLIQSLTGLNKWRILSTAEFQHFDDDENDEERGAEGELVLLEFLNFPLLIVNIGVLTSIGMERERDQTNLKVERESGLLEYFNHSCVNLFLALICLQEIANLSSKCTKITF